MPSLSLTNILTNISVSSNLQTVFIVRENCDQVAQTYIRSCFQGAVTNITVAHSLCVRKQKAEIVSLALLLT